METLSSETTQTTKKRNVWTSPEVRFFLSLVKEKQILGLMDGKRIRVSDIFKTLVGPMRENGFIRDATQLIVKYKNLKAEYYKATRHNSVSGNNPYHVEFFEDMHEILGNRPVSQATNDQVGFDNIPDIPVLNENDPGVLNVLSDVEVVYEDAPDGDGAIPGTSKEPGIKRVSVEPPVQDETLNQQGVYKKRKVKTGSDLENFFKKSEENRKKELEAEKDMLNNFVVQQQLVMKECAKFFVEGLKEIFKKKKSASDSDSD